MTNERFANKPAATVFIHVPKTGGSTVAGIINRQYRRDQIVGVGYNHFESQQRFLAMSDEEKSKIRCVRGHVRYGIQDELPIPYRLITVLRDPVGRFISEYKHLISRGSVRLKFPEGTLDSPEAHLEHRVSLNSMNMQTSQFSGYLTFGEMDGSALEPLPADALEKAKANLETFDVPGTLERFDESLLLMKRKLGWRKPIVSIRRNAAVTRGQKLVVTDELKKRVAECAHMDVALYEHARKLLAAKIEEEVGLAAEVRSLQRANKLLFQVQKTYTQLLPKNLRRTARKALGR